MKKVGKIGCILVYVIALGGALGCEAASESSSETVLGTAGAGAGAGAGPSGVCQDTITWSDPQGLGCSAYAGIPCTGEAAMNCPLTCGTCNGGQQAVTGSDGRPVEPCTGFQCVSGLCIENSKFCDGIWNCPDGDDESACDEQASGGGMSGGGTEGESGSGTGAGQTCEFECGDGYCISQAWVCDGNPDCNEGEDEYDCEGSEASSCDGYTCSDGSCIPSVYVCNTFEDCPGGEDEKNCNEGEGGEFCETYCFTGECILATQQCDGVMDCPDGSDEVSCDGCEYLCNNGECIPDAYVCDGEEDCNSGEDEELCAGDENGNPGGSKPGSCVGYCGQAQASPDGCFCDSNCITLGDCCEDICDVCPTLGLCI